MTNPVAVIDGHVAVTDRPGLGIAVNEDEAAKHPFAQEVLMQTYHRDGAVADW